MTWKKFGLCFGFNFWLYSVGVFRCKLTTTSRSSFHVSKWFQLCYGGKTLFFVQVEEQALRLRIIKFLEKSGVCKLYTYVNTPGAFILKLACKLVFLCFSHCFTFRSQLCDLPNCMNHLLFTKSHTYTNAVFLQTYWQFSL